VLILPQVESDRYCSCQINDLWGFVIDNAGSINDDNDGGAYLLTTRNWQGELPKGVRRVIMAESPWIYCNIRTQLFEEADYPRVREIQNSFRLIPLHEFLGTPSPAPAPELDWPPFAYGDEKEIDAFKYVNFLLPFLLQHPFDKESLEKAARIGVSPSLEWKPEAFSPELQQAIRDGIDDALAEIDAAGKRHSPPGERFDTRENMGVRFLHRAVGAYASHGGNTRDQAVYRRWFKDENGEFLDCSKHSYKITFTRDQLPQARYFWSLTMYDMPNRFLVPNPLNRYSLGSRAYNTFTHNPDGGFDVHVSKDAPAKEHMSNWLPAPDGKFTLNFRIFGPDRKMQNDEYDDPVIRVAS
jgi:hypothetical protein